MSAYVSLAPYYDILTRDVPYEKLADVYAGILARYGVKPGLTLDLACGTGSLTCILAGRGYEMIGADASAEMLAVAEEKARTRSFPAAPVFICQPMQELDLYGTVAAAVCSLDGLDYVPPEALDAVFERLRLFVEPGGVLAFDVLTPEELAGRDGAVCVDEAEGVFCVWRSEFLEGACTYGIDLFVGDGGGAWRRCSEEHTEYAHARGTLESALHRHGFGEISAFPGDTALFGGGRIFMAARRL